MFDWNLNLVTINGNSKEVDKATMVHEFGHVLGLPHLVDSLGSIMYPKKLVVHPDAPTQIDIEHFKHLYEIEH